MGRDVERALLAGILAGTMAAALLAARNNFAPVQRPLTFALVFWLSIVVFDTVLASGAFLACWLATRPFVASRPSLAGLPRRLLRVASLVFLAVGVASNLPALRSVLHLRGVERYRWLLPVALACSALGLLAVGLLSEARRGVPRAFAALAVAAALGAFLPAPMAPGRQRQIADVAPRPPGQPLLVIGIDGADWDLMEPLIARGELPRLAALRSRGAWGPLKSFEPTVSPAIWTTIVTGKTPEEHGIEGFAHLRLRGVDRTLPSLRRVRNVGFSPLYDLLVSRRLILQAPVASTARRVPAYWDIASAYGSPVSVVGWWATWPAEPILGHMVSESAYYSLKAGGASTVAGITHPESLAAEIAGSVVRPGQMTYQDVLRFADVTPAEFEAMQRAPTAWSPELTGGLTYFDSLFETTRRITLQVIVRGRTDFRSTPDVLVLFRLVDMTCHTSLQHSELVRDHRGSSPDDVRKFGRVVTEAYRSVDHAVGELMEAFGEGTVVIVSDHGWELEAEGYNHRKAPDGIFIAAGAAFRPGRVEGLTVFDVLPVLLHVKGFAVAEDLAGRLRLELFEPRFVASHPVQRVGTYGKREEMAPVAGSSAVDEEQIERLKALGYLQ